MVMILNDTYQSKFRDEILLEFYTIVNPE